MRFSSVAKSLIWEMSDKYSITGNILCQEDAKGVKNLQNV